MQSVQSDPKLRTRLASSSKTTRRAAPAGPAQSMAVSYNRSKKPFILIAVASMVAGIFLGGYVMRERYKRLANEVVVSVNGSNITKDIFYRRLEQAAGAKVIRELVGEELILQFAKRQGKLPTNTEIEARLALDKQSPNYKDSLKRSGRTDADVRRSLLVSMAQTSVLNRDVNVTEAEVRQFYDRNVDRKNPTSRYYTPESIQVAVIVSKTREESEAAMAEIEQGRPWSSVVKAHSQDSSRMSGGVLPPFLRGRTRSKDIPGMEAVLFSMKIGQLIGPRKFSDAWWIIRCLDRQPEVTQPFEKVKEECRTGAMLVKSLPNNSKKVESEFTDFQSKATIQAFWKQYKETVKVD